MKNPSYPDTKYVEELVGPDTVNTMPMQTLLACAERLRGAPARPCARTRAGACDALAEAGIDIDDVTDKLLREGIDAFVTPMEKLLAGIEAKREAIFTGRPETIDSSLPDELEPPIAELVERAATERVARRIWAKDDTLWGDGRARRGRRPARLADGRRDLRRADRRPRGLRRARPPRRAHRRGAARHGRLEPRARGAAAARSATRCTGACACTCSTRPTPARCSRRERAVDLDHTLFLVSTKSGGTIETLLAVRALLGALRPHGEQFVAITDPGSSLEALAARARLPPHVPQRPRRSAGATAR